MSVQNSVTSEYRIKKQWIMTNLWCHYVTWSCSHPRTLNYVSVDIHTTNAKINVFE